MGAKEETRRQFDPLAYFATKVTDGTGWLLFDDLTQEAADPGTLRDCIRYRAQVATEGERIRTKPLCEWLSSRQWGAGERSNVTGD